MLLSFETSSDVFSSGVKIYPFTHFYCPHKLCWCARTRGCQQGFIDVFYPNIVKRMNWSKFSYNAASADLSRGVSDLRYFRGFIFLNNLCRRLCSGFHIPTLKTISARYIDVLSNSWCRWNNEECEPANGDSMPDWILTSFSSTHLTKGFEFE